MKRLLFCLAAVAFIFIGWPQAIKADSGWQIESFASNIQVQNDGIVRVEETITALFVAEKHGIYRDIPVSYRRQDNSVLYTVVTPVSVTRNGTTEPFTVERNSGYLRIKIGDASKLISGEQRYEIVYTVKGALSGYDSFDELYWNVTGNGWEVPIGSASARVEIPTEPVKYDSCYVGKAGSTERCAVKNIDLRTESFGPTRWLSAGEGMTIALGYPKGAVPLTTVSAKEAGIVETPLGSVTSQMVMWIAVVVVSSLAGLAVVAMLWYRKGRDWWWRNPQALDPSQPAERRPLFGRDTVVVEFTPPNGLPPGMMGLLKDEKADTLDITSTIVDFACRGYLTIEEQPKQWFLGAKDYTLKRADNGSEGLLPYEDLLLNRLFADGNNIKISSLKDSFYKDLKEVKDQLYQDAVSAGYFSKNPQSTRGVYVTAGAIMAIGGGILLANSNGLAPTVVGAIIIGVMVSGVGLMAVSWFMSARTALGHELYRRSLGYRLFISTAEKYRQQFFEQQNLFNQVLPYAMMFGSTHKFAEAMKQIGYEPPQPTWYTGYAAFSALSFADDMAGVSKALSTTMASAPSSSGSGGGGFSGGGFGGGGGGSW